VIDEIAPVFDPFLPEVTIGCNDEWPTLNASDNCGDVVITTHDEIIASDCEYEYDVYRELTATDPCGNVTTVQQIIHVGDHSGPVIQGVEPELCDDTSLPEVTAWDPCAEQYVEVTMTEELIELPCPGKVLVRIWSATDLCGNVSTAEQHIIIGDTEPPVIQVPTWSIIRKYMDNAYNFVNLSEKDIIDQLNDLSDASIFVHDACDIWIIPEFNVDITYSEDCDDDGWWEYRVYTWTATDACGNQAVLTFSIYIGDDLPPVFQDVPADITVICDGLPPVPQVHATDYASPIEITYEQVISNGNAPGEFIVTRTWTATDPCENVAQSTQTILWIPDTFGDCDILLPALVNCNSHGVVIGSDVNGGLGDLSYQWEVVGQECFIQSGQGTGEILIYVGFGEIDIFLTVTDSYGCQTVCQASLDCLDPLDDLISPPSTDNPDDDNVKTGQITSTQQDYLQKLSYWPNPANTMLNLSFNAMVDREVEIAFMNFLGETVLTERMNAHVGKNTRRIDVSTLPEGTYLFQIMTDKEVHAKGIVIMR
jgi:hypothetical protein